jgi:hypothetical protein
LRRSKIRRIKAGDPKSCSDRKRSILGGALHSNLLGDAVASTKRRFRQHDHELFPAVASRPVARADRLLGPVQQNSAGVHHVSANELQRSALQRKPRGGRQTPAQRADAPRHPYAIRSGPFQSWLHLKVIMTAALSELPNLLRPESLPIRRGTFPRLHR